MNGAHDMGGMHGFGRVVPEENEPVFHADWERTVFGISRGASGRGLINIDESRHGIERMPPAEYLAASYYERWLRRWSGSSSRKGSSRRRSFRRGSRCSATSRIRRAPARGPDVRRAHARRPHRPPALRAGGRRSPPRFAVGDRVVARNVHPTGHTRLPRYARGKRGTIHEVRGSYVFPDANAHGQGEQPQPMYTSASTGAELWGASTEPRERVYIDLWESYLEPDA